MATISSLIINNDQADSLATPTSNEMNSGAKDIINPNLSDDTSALDLLAEIQAIKDAILSNENFDFTTLDSPAAGQINSIPSNDKSVSSSPILLSEDDLLIQYRSDGESVINTSSPSENLADNVISNPVADSFFSDAQNTQINQFQSNLNEDFVTRTEGTFGINSDISPQTIDSEYGQLITHDDGTWSYTLNNQHTDIQALSAGTAIEDTISLTSNSGQKIELSMTINGSNDQAVITGQKQATIDALPVNEAGDSHSSIRGQLNVSDKDTGEARFDTNFDIKGSFGTAQINALGEWSYTLDNTSDAVQGLLSGEKIFDLFSVKTLDGTKQLIQVSIQGVDDKPLLSGKNVAILDLETDLNTQGNLIVNDPDFGQSAFQAFSNIQSSLGYGSAEIDAQGNWSFSLDSEFTSSNVIDEGQTRIDSFEVFTVDGTSQTIHIPIQGSDSPRYAQANTPAHHSESLAINEILSEETAQNNHELTALLNAQSEQSNNEAELKNTDNTNQQIEVSIYMNSDSQEMGSQLNQHLNDIPTS